MKLTIKIVLATLLAMVCMTGFAQEQQSALDNIFARKSVRSYTDEPVSPEQVETILKAAMAAPSGMNMQPWRFVVVTDQKVKDKLAIGFNKMIAKAPVVIIVCGKTRSSQQELDCRLRRIDRKPAAGSRSPRPWRRVDRMLSVRRPHEPHRRSPRAAREHQSLLHSAHRTPCRERQAQGQMEPGEYPLRKVVVNY